VQAGAFDVAGELLHNTDILQCGRIFTRPDSVMATRFSSALLSRLESSLHRAFGSQRAKQHSTRAYAQLERSPLFELLRVQRL